MNLYCKKTQNDNGQYQDENGVRYQVDKCVMIFHPKRLTPAQLGYTTCDSLEAFLEDNKLTVYEDPEMARMMEEAFLQAEQSQEEDPMTIDG